MSTNKGEDIPGLNAILAKAMSTAVCRECRAEIPVAEWRQYARMCKKCWDSDGEMIYEE